jgi:uncharacterized Zn finger protein
MQVSCLRCSAHLEHYFVTEMTFLPYGEGHSHAMVECPRCGHVEMFARNSSMLKDLQVVTSAVGDGD